MQDINLRAITTDRILLPQFTTAGIEVDMLRLDKIHQFISGNKWFKLRYYIEEAKAQNKKRVITFGGAWSNHLLATAAACRLHQLACTGIIRGEKPALLSDTLQRAAEMGMQLVFLDRSDYAIKNIPAELYHEDHYIIQQGGFGEHGVRGAAEIMKFADRERSYSHIFCAVGTGTMLAGLARTIVPPQLVTGISVLKNNFQLDEEVKQLSGVNTDLFRITHDYHFGGYARHDPSLILFMNEWYTASAIPTDIVYTGKLCFAVHDMARKNNFPPGSRVLLIHSGGLTGNASLKKGTLIF
jgi:1-aminocyclopropane-1-carboxylate deaminase